MRARTAFWLAVAGVVVGAAARRLVAYEIADHSMEPALRPGDWVLGMSTRRALPGWIVVFEHPQCPGFDLVKRAAAAPGPAQSRPHPGDFWALGDNPAAGSVDSRSLGFIPASALRARLLLRYRPRPLRWLV